MSQRPMSNTEFVAHLMEFAKSGPIMQMVIISAIDNYTKGCLMAKPGFLGNAGALVNEEAWLTACNEFQAAMKVRLEPGQTQFVVTEKVREEDLDSLSDLDDDDFWVCLQNSHLQELRNGAILAIDRMGRGDTSANHDGLQNLDAITALRHGLTTTGGAYVSELVRD